LQRRVVNEKHSIVSDAETKGCRAGPLKTLDVAVGRLSKGQDCIYDADSLLRVEFLETLLGYPNSKQLRGTFVTLSLANGKTETWVADRTGHRSSAMINRYRRAARSAMELGLGGLAPLYLVIPELAPIAPALPQDGPTDRNEEAGHETQLDVTTAIGEMSEWPKVPDSKSGVPARVPWVRIPLSPPEAGK
jgi:hypothetical protein